MDGSVSWPVGVAVAGGLVTAIGVLWRIVLNGIQDTQAKLAKCETHHGEQSCKVEALGIQFARLEGRMEERNETVEKLERLDTGIESLSSAVLELVHLTGTEGATEGNDATGG